jgi:hypothetical protein
MQQQWHESGGGGGGGGANAFGMGGGAIVTVVKKDANPAHRNPDPHPVHTTGGGGGVSDMTVSPSGGSAAQELPGDPAPADDLLGGHASDLLGGYDSAVGGSPPFGGCESDGFSEYGVATGGGMGGGSRAATPSVDSESLIASGCLFTTMEHMFTHDTGDGRGTKKNVAHLLADLNANIVALTAAIVKVSTAASAASPPP